MLQLYAHCFVEELGKTKKEMVNLDWSDFEWTVNMESIFQLPREGI